MSIHQKKKKLNTAVHMMGCGMIYKEPEYSIYDGKEKRSADEGSEACRQEKKAFPRGTTEESATCDCTLKKATTTMNLSEACVLAAVRSPVHTHSMASLTPDATRKPSWFLGYTSLVKDTGRTSRFCWCSN
jgi:hypothetical protein